MDAELTILGKVILALFMLTLAGMGALIMSSFANLRKDIKDGFKSVGEQLGKHSEEDDRNFKELFTRTDRHAQRLTLLDKQTER